MAEKERRSGSATGVVHSKKSLSYLVYLNFKRFFDVSIACLLLALSSPIFLFAALAINIDSSGGVFYRHKRVGKNGKTIYLYKFRSMRDGADKELEKMLKDPKIRKEWNTYYKIHDDPRITRVGKILRKTSIDELPQLLNILRGDMSLIGPRPLVEDELEKYGDNKNKFLSVTPGVAGWWACNGRSARTYEDRMNLELYYIDHQSLWMDMRTIWKTIGTVLKGHGAV